jgi:hypothetical protein
MPRSCGIACGVSCGVVGASGAGAACGACCRRHRPSLLENLDVGKNNVDAEGMRALAVGENVVA